MTIVSSTSDFVVIKTQLDHGENLNGEYHVCENGRRDASDAPSATASRHALRTAVREAKQKKNLIHISLPA